MTNENVSRGCLAIAGTVLLTAVLVPVGMVAWFLIQSHRYMTVREKATIVLPDGVHEIEHSRIGVNPLVAEYSRDVTYVADGQQGKTTPLQVDTCGGYPINCYLIKTPHATLLRLDDAVSEHLLDVDSQTTYLVVRDGGVACVGELTTESPTMSAGSGNPAMTPMSALTQNQPETYLGRLEGGFGNLRFIPAAESPEIRIKHLFD